MQVFMASQQRGHLLSAQLEDEVPFKVDQESLAPHLEAAVAKQLAPCDLIALQQAGRHIECLTSTFH